jgi:hypothetical protein
MGRGAVEGSAKSSVARILVAIALAFGPPAACGARGDLAIDIDPSAGGNGGPGARGGAAGRGGTFGRDAGAGRGGRSGTGGAFGRGGTGALGGGNGGSAGALGSAGVFGRGGSAGGLGSGGGGRDGGAENCTNFADDDHDGATDCEDTDCRAGFICVPENPDGWSGPLVLWEQTAADGSVASPEIACETWANSQLLAVGRNDFEAKPPSCAECACGPPEGMACERALVLFGEGQNCGGTVVLHRALANSCTLPVLPAAAQRGARWQAPAEGGTCEARALGDSIVPPLTWRRQALLCADGLQGAGCRSGACFPRPAAPFHLGTCVVRDGDVPCPAGYPHRAFYYADSDDTRDCTPCSCAQPAGASCTGSVTVSTDLVCSTDSVTLRSPDVCSMLPPDPSPPQRPDRESRSVLFEPGSPVGGSCTASGGRAVGEFLPLSGVTVCCTPPPPPIAVPTATSPPDGGRG